MTPWRRAEPVGPMTAFAFIIVAIGVAFTAFITFALVKGVRWEVNPIAGSLAIYGFMTVWTGLAWRMYRTGIYVSGEALRIINPWRNRTVPWTDIAEISRQPAMIGSWETMRDAIFLRLTDGALVETPVQQTAGFFAGGVRKNAGPVLSEADFDALLASLQEKLGQATAARPPRTL